MNKVLKFTKVRDVKTPEYGTPHSAGIDFFVPNDFVEVILNPSDSVVIPSGIHVNIPEGYVLIGQNKSGMATKNRLQIGANIIDSDYQGEIHLHVYNTSGNKSIKITPGLKLIQFLLIPVESANLIEYNNLAELYPEKTIRGDGKFGSTGIK